MKLALSLNTMTEATPTGFVTCTHTHTHTHTHTQRERERERERDSYLLGRRLLELRPSIHQPSLIKDAPRTTLNILKKRKCMHARGFDQKKWVPGY